MRMIVRDDGRDVVFCPEWTLLSRRCRLVDADSGAVHSPEVKGTILKSMKEGLAFIRQREGLSALVILAFITTLLGFSLTAFLRSSFKPYFIKASRPMNCC
jgi:hypothetical protein